MATHSLILYFILNSSLTQKLQHQLVHEKESHSESENILNNSEYRHKILVNNCIRLFSYQFYNISKLCFQEKQCEIDRLNILIQRKENVSLI